MKQTDLPTQETKFVQSPQAHQRWLERCLGLMFFASGAAALVYQVLFAKRLALVFGSTATATFTVLATFLGGMALGSLLGGRMALRVRRPLAAYAAIELLIGVYCAITPWLFDLIQHAYIALASGDAPDAAWVLVLRVALGAAVLLVPTILMGATLPLLTQVLSAGMQRIGTKIAWLYFTNTAGAAVGALLTAYFVIPALGIFRTTLVAVALNTLVAVVAFLFSRKPFLANVAAPSPGTGNMSDLPKRAAIAALLSLGVGGVLSLGLEVAYVHLLSIVAGNSVYAFGLMLATFLIGLAGGGEAARRLLLNPASDRVRLLAYALLGLAVSVAVSVWCWNGIPNYFGSFENHPAASTFASREAIRGAVCAFVMLPATVFIGAAYAFGMDIVTSASRRQPIAMLGAAAALNTLGNISGVLIFGFGLLPLIGGLGATRVITVSALLLGIAVLLLCAKMRRRDLVLFGAAVVVLLVSFRVQLDYASIGSGANVYFRKQRWGIVVDHAESIDGGLTMVARGNTPNGPIKTLLTNGKFQGNDAWNGEMQAQLGIAFAPLLHQERRDRALVIGYGTGVTSRVFHEAGFRQLDIAELSHDVIRLADTHFSSVNKGVSSARDVHLHVTDGRNFLLLSDPQRRYDVISIEISSIWFAGAASLYNREFYQLAHSRLEKDGVLQQWVQLHHLTPQDVLSIITSLRSEFRYVSLYVIGGQGILIATDSEERKDPTATAMALLEHTDGVADALHILSQPLTSIREERLLDTAGIDRFIEQVGGEASRWWSTDDNLRLEYSTPKANVNDSAASTRLNLKLLSQAR
jgi:predicted membrane-bound spermidine synthase